MCSVADQISPDARRHFRGDRAHGCADDVSDEISWVWRPEHQQSLRELDDDRQGCQIISGDPTATTTA